jgi:hypothetical protein
MLTKINQLLVFTIMGKKFRFQRHKICQKDIKYVSKT